MDIEFLNLYSDFDIFKNLQEKFFPPNELKLIGLDVFSDYVHSTGYFTDYFDFILLENNKYFFYVADVSRNGCYSLFIVNLLKIFLRNFINNYRFPNIILSILNSKFVDIILPDFFISFFCGIYDNSTKKLLYSTAGFPEILLIKNKSNKIESLKTNGNIINLKNNSEYELKEVYLDLNDKLFFFTNGFLNQNFSLNDIKNFLLENNNLYSKDLLKKLSDNFINKKNTTSNFLTLLFEIKDNYICLHTLDEIMNFIRFLEIYFRHLNIDDATLTNLIISIQEAAINAFSHGNNEDITKKIIIFYEYKIENGTFLIRIRDEGEGFDYNNLPDPTKDENLLKESGRGIFIIKSYMDKVFFNDKGNEITMIKKIF